jgi:hypothetical protein
MHKPSVDLCSECHGLPDPKAAWNYMRSTAVPP